MRWVSAWVGLLAAAVALSFWCASSDRLPGDLWLTRRVQDLPGWFEPAAEAIRAATTTWLVVLLGVGVAVVASVAFRRWSWLWFVAGMLLIPPVQALIKNLVDRPRPDPDLVERRAGFTSESFPSGHVLGSTALVILCACVVASVLPKGWQRIAAWSVAAALALVSGLANVYEGVHWPSDVLGGYLWAAAFVFGSWLLAERFRKT